MQGDADHALVLAMIAATCRRDATARMVVPRLLAQACEIASHLPEEDRAEVAAIMREAADELDQIKKQANGTHLNGTGNVVAILAR
jgi:hypothetical protein